MSLLEKMVPNKVKRVVSGSDNIDVLYYQSPGLLFKEIKNTQIIIPDDRWTYGGTYHKNESEYMKDIIRGTVPKNMYTKYIDYKKRLPKKLTAKYYENRGMSCKRTRKIMDDGDELSISRWMAGMDDYWSATVRDNNRKNIRIAINTSGSSALKEADMVAMACQTAAAVEIIYALGYSVELLASDFSEYVGPKDTDYCLLLTNIKRARAKTNIQRVLSLAYPGWLRDTTFKIAKDKFEYVSGYGKPAIHTEDIKKKMGLHYIFERGLSNQDFSDDFSKLLADISGNI